MPGRVLTYMGTIMMDDKSTKHYIQGRFVPRSLERRRHWSLTLRNRKSFESGKKKKCVLGMGRRQKSMKVD